MNKIIELSPAEAENLRQRLNWAKERNGLHGLRICTDQAERVDIKVNEQTWEPMGHLDPNCREAARQRVAES